MINGGQTTNQSNGLEKKKKLKQLFFSCFCEAAL